MLFRSQREDREIEREKERERERERITLLRITLFIVKVKPTKGDKHSHEVM